jgi:hypothetical protein
MAEKTNKSHFMKLSEKDTIFFKLKEAIKELERNDRSIHKEPSKIKESNKSNFSSPTTSRIKEDMGDKDFLSNFMYIDDHSNILPKDMHLLTDNDTNQSISSQEKYKNLSNLMLDDKNITGLNFIRSSEERIKLNLYVAFSKKSRDLFMNDNHPNRTKNQVLFHKINDMHIPKFEFKPSNAHNDALDKNALDKSIGIESNNNLNSISERNNNEKNNNISNNNDKSKKENKGEEENNEKEEKKFTECYFRQEKKGYFHIPSLAKIEAKPPPKKESKKQRIFLGIKKLDNIFKKDNNNKRHDDIFWDPEIDADTLSYINHNFISIEDIYNKKNIDLKDKNNNPIIPNDEDEPNLTPIKAKEIFIDVVGKKTKSCFNNFLHHQDKNEEEGGNGEYDKLKYEGKNDNKFIEFIEINPGIIKIDYDVLSNAKKEMRYEFELKKDFREKINRISDIDVNEFPKNVNYNAKKIERFLRFQKLVKEKREIDLTLKPKPSTEDSDKKIKEFENKNNQRIEKNENIVKNEIKAEEIKNLNEKKTLKDKTFSDIEEKKSFSDEENEEESKNSLAFNSQSSQNLEKSSSRKVFNFNDDNSDHSQFYSDKS